MAGNAFLSRGKVYARTPVGGGKRHCSPVPWATNVEEARERATVLADMATRLRATGDPSIVELLPKLLDRAAAAEAKALRTILETVDRLVSGKVAPVRVGAMKGGDTFADVAKAWTSGELAKRYPDHIRAKRSQDQDASRVERYINPIVGSVPMRSFTVEHAENVMAALPATFSASSRRHAAQAINRVVGLAVYPLRLLSVNPLPKGWMPKVRSSDVKPQEMPFPVEADALVSSPAVPVPLRLLAGFIAREGMRHEEAEGLTWGDLDLAAGIVRLEENKTDDPRSWAMRPGTARALRRWHELRGKPTGSALVFVNADGAKLNARAGDDFREALRLAGVARTEIHQGSKTTKPAGFHGLRALFVTEALARGMTERWVSDRTGHKSSQMISRYQRKARTFAEAKVATLGELDAVIGWGDGEQDPGPENQDPPVANGRYRTPKARAKRRMRARKSAKRRLLITGSLVRVQQSEPSNSEGLASKSHPEPTKMDPAPDPDAALAVALERASAAGQWEIVGQLAGELQARRLAREGVVSIATKRGRG